MTAEIIDGKAIAAKLVEGAAEEVKKLKEKAGRAPGLAVVLVGDNPASKVYVSRKEANCDKAGIVSRKIELPETVSQEELEKVVRQLNEDEEIDGILVQLPLPKHLEEGRIMQLISPSKDVDGFHADNVGKMFLGVDGLWPCTARGVMTLIDSTGVEVKGKDACVVGRSNIVGKPVSMMLLNRGATVTTCHSKTKDLKSHTRNADILVVATGVRALITKEMVKEGAVVIDVGINRLESGKLVGDVDFEAVKETAGHLTPVPGGVGPMTVACLMLNTIQAFKERTGAGK